MVTAGPSNPEVVGPGQTERGLSVRQAAAEAAEVPALLFGDRAWTWTEAAREADRVAIGIRATLAEAPSAARRPILALDARPTPSVVFTLLALIEAGLPFVPLDPRLPAGERARRIRGIPGCVDLDGLVAAGSSSTGNDAAAPTGNLGPDQPLAFLFSSGSTGAPRLIELSRGAFAASAAASAARLGWKESDRWLCCLPLAHVGGVSIIIRCLLSRRTVVLSDGFDAAGVGATLRNRDVTLASFVPTMLVRLLDLVPDWRRPPSLRAILLGGAPAGADLWRRIEEADLPVRATYGMTESCSQVATATAAAPGLLEPLEGVEFRERAGRLEVRGPTLCTSIDGVAAPEGPDWAEDGFLRTGDLGRVLEDGAIEVTGRADRLILTGGENVAPAEVEAVLEALPGIARALVFGVEDAEWGEVVAAVLVPAGERPGRTDLAAWCAGRLPPYARPRRVAWVSAIPSTATGKPDVRAAREAALPRLEVL